jgi:hypothetical protein
MTLTDNASRHWQRFAHQVEWRDGSIHTVDDNDPTVVRCLQWGQLYGVENIDWGQFYCSPEYAFVLQLLS